MGEMARYYDPDGRAGTAFFDEPEPWLRMGEIEPFLKQKKVWKNIFNEEISLENISARYAGNILRFLERKAPDLIRTVVNYQMYVESQRDFITGAPENLLRSDPVKWIRQQPLYKAIQRVADDV